MEVYGNNPYIYSKEYRLNPTHKLNENATQNKNNKEKQNKTNKKMRIIAAIEFLSSEKRLFFVRWSFHYGDFFIHQREEKNIHAKTTTMKICKSKFLGNWIQNIKHHKHIGHE